MKLSPAHQSAVPPRVPPTIDPAPPRPRKYSYLSLRGDGMRKWINSDPIPTDSRDARKRRFRSFPTRHEAGLGILFLGRLSEVGE